jgi:hypothetical protein
MPETFMPEVASPEVRLKSPDNVFSFDGIKGIPGEARDAFFALLT